MASIKKLRVGVFMGGRSIEKEVSFNSGRTICDHLDRARYEVIPLFQKSSGEIFILPLRFLHRGKISDFEHRLNKEARLITWDELKKIIDFAYLAVHGRYAEDGTLQGFLEVLGIPYLGAKVFSSALSRDKIIQKAFLRMNNIEVPREVSLTPTDINQYTHTLDSLIQFMNKQSISFPCIVKPYKEGSSFGVSIVKNKSELIPALHHASTIHYGIPESVLIEEKIKGMEFTCIILTDYKTGKPIFLPPTELVYDAEHQIFDYEQKYMPGKAIKFTPARCNADATKKIQDVCWQATQALGITNISRIDGFLTHDERVILFDFNILAGMAPSSFLFKQAAEIGMGHSQVINHLIETELHHYGMLSGILEEEKKGVTTMNDKIRVAVLLGGNTNEREISLESGRNIVYKLSQQKYAPTPLFLDNALNLYKLSQQLLVMNSTKGIEAELDDSMKVAWADLPSIADFVFIGLHGGVGENGSVQGTLEMLGMPYNGSSVFASGLCMDKYKTNQFLKSQGFNIPQGILVSKKEWQENQQATIAHILRSIPMPLIIKPHDDGCSVFVSKARAEIEIIQSLNEIFLHKDHALIEECIKGMELTVGVVGNEEPHALPPSQAVTNKDILSIEEKFLPGAGENQTPAPLPEETLSLVKKTMEQVYQAVGCKGYARIDCFYQSSLQSPTGKERVVILEINTLPGMTPATVIFHQAAELGIAPMDFVDMIIELGFAAHSSLTNKEHINNEKTILKRIIDQPSRLQL